MLKKLLSILFIFVVCAACLTLFFQHSPKAREQKLLEIFKQRDYRTLESKLSGTHLPHPTSLYKGYLAQMERRFSESDRYFQHVLPLLSQKEDKKPLAEIYLSLATNAYLAEKHDEFFSYVTQAKTTFPQHYALPFFEALEAYLHGDYTKACTCWGAFSPPEELRQQSWFLIALDSLYSSQWKDLYLAHALIESGDIIAGRALLESESRFLEEDPVLHPFAIYLLGLSYLVEAKQAPLHERESHYKIAQYYFESVPVSAEFLSQHAWVTRYVKDTTETLLLTESEESCKSWGLAFIHLLHAWEEKETIEGLAQKIALKILTENDLVLCQSIRNEFQGTPFHVLITQKMLDTFTQTLLDGCEDPFEPWSLIHALSPFTDESARELACYTLHQVFQTIYKRDTSFKYLDQYISFWEQFNPQKEEKEAVAQELIFLAKQFWLKEGEEKKGEYLMTLALKLSNHVRDEIEAFLVDLYHQAENNNLISRLSVIYESLDHFHIHRQELITKSLIANHLADALYMYEARHYYSAKTISCWLLKIEPTNGEALRLAGLSYFHLGDYNSAYSLLKELQDPDPLTYKALLLSQVLASQAQGKHLAQIGHAD